MEAIDYSALLIVSYDKYRTIMKLSP